MKLFMIEYQVQLKDGKDTLTVKDKIAVPGKSPKGAQAQFLRTAQASLGLLVPYKDVRLLVPIRDMGGEVTVISCGPLSK